MDKRTAARLDKAEAERQKLCFFELKFVATRVVADHRKPYSPVYTGIVGDHLDNAMGEHFSLTALSQRHQEFLLVYSGVGVTEPKVINLASFIAAVRAVDLSWSVNSANYNDALAPNQQRLREITSECRSDMHEPDEQNVSVTVLDRQRFEVRKSGSSPRNDQVEVFFLPDLCEILLRADLTDLVNAGAI